MDRNTFCKLSLAALVALAYNNDSDEYKGRFHQSRAILQLRLKIKSGSELEKEQSRNLIKSDPFDIAQVYATYNKIKDELNHSINEGISNCSTMQ